MKKDLDKSEAPDQSDTHAMCADTLSEKMGGSAPESKLGLLQATPPPFRARRARLGLNGSGSSTNVR
jgi:hypothetical protein